MSIWSVDFATLTIMLLVFTLALWRVLRCKHAWEFVDKTELPSRAEVAQKTGVLVHVMADWRIQEMTRKKVVIVLRCNKCGNAKVLKESN